jgi:dimeric dUTPase (all-alpha-NTP-PPase superfamily)
MGVYKKLYKVGIFSVVTFLCLLSFSWLVDRGVKYSGDEEFKKVNKIMTERIDPDIIAFGSSVGEKSFNSNIVSARTGLVSYNCCIDGTNFEQYKGLIEEYNKYSSKKSIVLLFESYFSLQQLQGISGIERFCAYLDNPRVYGDLAGIDPGLTWKSRYIPLYKNTVVDHTYYIAAFNGWRSYLLHRKAQDQLQGFLPKYSNWEADQDAVITNMRAFRITIDKKVVSDYVNTIRMLRRQGRQVVIVLPPVYERLYLEKTDFNPLRTTLDSVARVTGCTFMDFSVSAISHDKEYFYNTNHLNFKGSHLFSEQLGDSLKRRFPPDRR